MSAIPHRGPHVRELFVKTGPALAVGCLEADHHESGNNYDLSDKKKRRAPAPPVGLGQYKPKILAEDSDGNVPLNNNSGSGGSHAPRNGRGQDSNPDPSAKTQGASKSTPFIMGDKDTPLVLHSPSGTYGLETDIRDLQVSSNNEGEGMVIGTSNPLFDPQSPKANGDVSGSNEKVPRYEKRQKKNYKMDEENGEPEGIFIPAPDYDEEEKTMVFTDEPDDDQYSSEQPGKKVYKEYLGEDFAQYLSDEDNGLTEAWSQQKRPGRLPDCRSQTEVKRSQYKKRESLPSKNKKDKAFQGSSSLRSFSYADSKFGALNGSSKRLSVHSLSEDTGEAELFVSTGTSYEQFLRSKNGEELGDLLSSSLGTGAAPVPSRYTRPSHKKDTLWKKLTWRFRKQSRNGIDLDPS